MKRKIILWLLTAFCLLAFTSCGREEEAVEEEKEIVPTGEFAPVAEFTALSLPGEIAFYGSNGFYWDGEIFYLERKVVAGDEVNVAVQSLAAVAADGTGAYRIVEEGTVDGTIHHFFIDGEGSLYLYESKSPRSLAGYYLRKINADGQEVFRTDLDGIIEDDYTKIYVDGEGGIALIGYSNKEIVFLDSEGQYRGRADCTDAAEDEGMYMNNDANNLVCIGGRYYLWRVVDVRGSIYLREVDFQKMRVSDKIAMDVSSLAKDAASSRDYVLFDGGEQGFLVSTRDVLWQYDMKSGEAEEFFRWDGENIDVDGRHVVQINFGGAGEGGISMEVFAYEKHETYYSYPMMVGISYVDKAYIPERRVVSIGIDSSLGGIEDMVRRFNRLNPGYKAVLAEYTPSVLRELLMYGKEVPDLLDVTGIGTDWLDTKGLLEDLAPYFKESDAVGREDILPAVWGLLDRDGKLTSMATSFTIRSMTTTADVPEDGWSYDEFLGLAGRYPESRYFNRFNGMQVWGVVSSTGLDAFLDWKKMKCTFDGDEFKELLEGINSLDYPKRQWQNGTVEEEQERLLTQQVLFRYSSYGSPFGYDKEQEDYGGAVKSVGFPTADGEPEYLFSPSQNLAIYAYSPNKEGAWAFLEFVLSEGEQGWYSSEKDVFPVRSDAFEKYLTKPPYAINMVTNVPTLEDTPDKLRYMAEHLGMNRNAADEINAILSEELQAYFAGDKTVDEAAEIIQSRVQLYLDEM